MTQVPKLNEVLATETGVTVCVPLVRTIQIAWAKDKAILAVTQSDGTLIRFYLDQGAREHLIVLLSKPEIKGTEHAH